MAAMRFMGYPFICSDDRPSAVDRQRYADEIGNRVIRLQFISIWNLVTYCSCELPFICHLRGAGPTPAQNDARIARSAVAGIPDSASNHGRNLLAIRVAACFDRGLPNGEVL